jgi:hypothetical protein
LHNCGECRIGVSQNLSTKLFAEHFPWNNET